jgi:feruloyl esterase
VVVLHGCTQSAQDYAAGAGWLQLADAYGFAVLAPEQSQGNNANRCFNWFLPQDSDRDQGEAASIRQMTAVAAAAHRSDPSRVFVTGLSAGGAMTAALLADYPDVFAGGGVIAGLPYRAADTMMEAFGAMFQGRSQSPRRWGDLVRGAHPYAGPWPRVSIWQGDADKTVKPSNAEALVQQWSDLHGLAAGPTRTSVNRNHRRDVWLSAAGDPVVELNTITGLGHGTPVAGQGAEGWGAAGPFLLEAGVSSSLHLLEFWGVAAEASARPASAPLEPPTPQPVHPDPMEVLAAFAEKAAAHRPAIDLQDLMHKAMSLARRLR